jgi:acetyl-CoA acetyltransferase
MYALAASRHMHEYGTTRGQLAEVAVAARGWAKLNPKAFMREDLTVEEVLSSRMVSSPLGVRDCCLVTNQRREGQGSRRDSCLPAGSR